MPKYTNPDSLNIIWASNATSGDINKPSGSKIQQGRAQEKPTYENENWSMNKPESLINCVIG